VGGGSSRSFGRRWPPGAAEAHALGIEDDGDLERAMKDGDKFAFSSRICST